MKSYAARPAGPAMSSARRMCQLCPRNGAACQPGAYLARHLSAAIAASTLEDGFEISGTVLVEECGGDCRLAWRASTEGVWVFGDVPKGIEAEGIEAEASAQGGASRVLAAPAGLH